MKQTKKLAFTFKKKDVQEEEKEDTPKYQKSDPTDIKSLPDKGMKLTRSHKPGPLSFEAAIRAPRESVYQPISATKEDVLKRRIIAAYTHNRRGK